MKSRAVLRCGQFWIQKSSENELGKHSQFLQCFFLQKIESWWEPTMKSIDFSYSVFFIIIIVIIIIFNGGNPPVTNPQL